MSDPLDKKANAGQSGDDRDLGQLPRKSWQDQQAFNDAASRAKASLDDAERAANKPINPPQKSGDVLPRPPLPAYGAPPRPPAPAYGGPVPKPYDPSIDGPVPMPAYGGPMRRRRSSFAPNQIALLISVGAASFLAGFVFFFSQSFVVAIITAGILFFIMKFVTEFWLNR